MAVLAAVLSLLLLFPPSSHQFYVPGVAPQDFTEGQAIDVKAIKMTSAHTQLPYEYYSLDLCRPKDGVVEYYSQNLGQIIRGERIVNTPYTVEMGRNVECRVLCDNQKWSSKSSKEVGYRVEHEYFVHLIMDNLPCATRFSLPESSDVQYEPGYRLGYTSNGKNYINNHLKFVLKYHKDELTNTYRVVGFLIETASVDKSGLDIKRELSLSIFYILLQLN